MTRRLLWFLPLFILLLTQNVNAAKQKAPPNPAQEQEIGALPGAQSSPALPAPLQLLPRPTNLTCFPDPACGTDSDCADYCGGLTPHCWTVCPKRFERACACT